jgi:molybdopterin/thiamine biosynthesis adenylyltransferase
MTLAHRLTLCRKEDLMVKPALKPTIPYFRDGDQVHFRMAGELLSLDDRDGRVGKLLELLDGSRLADEVFAELQGDFPATSRIEFDDALADLDASRLVQDAAAPLEGLTPEEQERWSRNLGFFETYASLSMSKYFYQRRLMDTKVAMLGVGGVGSHVLMDMVAMGFTDIRVVDFDTVELSNLNRQVMYGNHCLGQPKVELAREWVMRFRPDVRVDIAQRKLMSADDVYDVVHDRDIVIAAVDRPKTRVLPWLNEGCVRAGAVLLTGGVDTQRAMHYTVVPGISGCLECWRSSVERGDELSQRMFTLLREREDAGLRFGEDMAAFNGLVVLQTAFLVGELTRLSTEIDPPLSVGRLLQVTFPCPVLTERESWTRDPQCPVCADAKPPTRFEWIANVVSSPPALESTEVWEHD